MQIKLSTARSLGYTGTAEGLRDPETNLTYAVKYLAGAYRAANGNHNRAVAYYAGGYYWVAKRQRDRKSTRLNSSHSSISYAVFCLKKKKNQKSHLIHNKKKQETHIIIRI